MEQPKFIKVLEEHKMNVHFSEYVTMNGLGLVPAFISPRNDLQIQFNDFWT